MRLVILVHRHGKLDNQTYFMASIADVNRTPITGSLITPEQRRERIEFLAGGLRSFE